MKTTRNKHWNGKIDTLNADYLKDVMEKMADYGDRVKFGLASGQRPHYQIMNAADKKMAFDSNHHLLHPQADEFVDSNATAIFTLEQLKYAMTGGAVKSSSGTRVSSGGTRRTATTVKAVDLIGAAKYEYFKNNRQTLPAGIVEYSAQITTLMARGLSAEDAFGEIIKQHF